MLCMFYFWMLSKMTLHPQNVLLKQGGGNADQFHMLHVGHIGTRLVEVEIKLGYQYHFNMKYVFLWLFQSSDWTLVNYLINIIHELFVFATFWLFASLMLQSTKWGKQIPEPLYHKKQMYIG